MKKFTLFIAVLFAAAYIYPQNYDPQIDSIISKTSTDTLVKYVRELSGEDTATVNGNPYLIINRENGTSGNNLAAGYLKEKLSGFGLTVSEIQYDSEGRNIIAIQQGTTYPSEEYFICAHYDAVTDYCADDNVSGCAAVLEAARILSKYKFEYTIVYALWDEEEYGLVGSGNYACYAQSNNEQISGVLNLDMIGWNGPDDMNILINTTDVPYSTNLSDLLMKLDTVYNLSLVPFINNPGASYSDHASFWQSGYPAVNIIEKSFNPFYHSVNDRIDKFNLTCFTRISKLSTATIAVLAVLDMATTTKEISVENAKISLYPNPVKDVLNIGCILQNNKNYGKCKVYDATGTLVIEKSFTRNKFNIEVSNLAKGLYLLRVENENGMAAKRFLKD